MLDLGGLHDHMHQDYPRRFSNLHRFSPPLLVWAWPEPGGGANAKETSSNRRMLNIEQELPARLLCSEWADYMTQVKSKEEQ